MRHFLTPFTNFGYTHDHRTPGMVANGWSPRIDVHETEAAYVLTAELPGIHPDDIDVTVEKNVLTIKGEKTAEKPAEAGSYASIERFSGTFERRFRLPDVVESDRVSAAARHGLIEITVPKAEAHHPQRIAITG